MEVEGPAWAGGSVAVANAVALLGVALIWGTTNVFMKRGAVGLEAVKGGMISELIWMFSNPSYAIPFVVNISGSALYYWVLGSAPLSMAVPLANMATFLVSAVLGQALGDDPKAPPMFWLGMCSVAVGVFLCVTAGL